MSYPLTTNDVAELLEVLGKRGEAATVRWGEPPPAEVAEERDGLADELQHATEMLEDLESLLCKACGKKWRVKQP